MKPEFSSTGLDIQTYDEIFQELVDEYKTIYGSDISVDSDDPDGQRIGIEANNILDLQQFAAYLYSSFDPDFASGTFLDVIFKYSGLYRRSASQSQWDLSVAVSKDVTLPATYTVKDELDQEWKISAETDITLASSPVSITFLAVNYGALEGVAGSTIEQVTFEPSVTSVTASADATIGIEEETDVEAKIRRNNSLLNPSYSTAGGLLARLLNLSGVTDAYIYENDTSTYDATLSLNDHSIWIIIEGGTLATIAETIVKNKTSGTGMKGSINETYTETVTKPDATTIDIDHSVYFDRPTEVDLYINANVSRKVATSSIDIAAIKTALAAKTYTIGEDSVASELYQYGYNGGTNFIMYDLEVSDDDVIYTDESIDCDPGSKFTIDTANITITEV